VKGEESSKRIQKGGAIRGGIISLGVVVASTRASSMTSKRRLKIED
jgi:hypothetical protein